MSEEDKLEIQIETLLNISEERIHIWTGTLEKPIQKSYVELSRIIKILNEKRKLLKDLRASG